jgi:transcriptional regulator with XRE-family HTH domain
VVEGGDRVAHVVPLTHALKPEAAATALLGTLPFVGKRSQMSLVEDTSAAAIAAVLDQVPVRLKRIRTRRKMTLTEVANETGISKSTLSRLETGSRRPTLELLLALSHTYRVPLDELVAAPEEGDPRLRFKAGSVKGRTVIPLTRQPDGMQAWKIVIPTSKVTPEPRSHDGHEWIYVLSGHVRFILADRDLELGPGEVAAFDTTIPHWFGSTGEDPAEILSIFGRPGERMTLRTTSPEIPAQPPPAAHQRHPRHQSPSSDDRR